MALIDEVRTRLSTNLLLQVTNPDDPTATTEGTAKLTAAVSDAQSVFEIVTGVVFDTDDARHVAYAVRGAMIYLDKYLGAPIANLDQKIESWRKELQEIRIATGRAIPNPVTTSNLVPTRETTDRPVRPFADRSGFNYVIPRSPRAQVNGQNQRSFD